MPDRFVSVTIVRWFLEVKQLASKNQRMITLGGLSLAEGSTLKTE
jgi:hypothetical protein